MHESQRLARIAAVPERAVAVLGVAARPGVARSPLVGYGRQPRSEVGFLGECRHSGFGCSDLLLHRGPVARAGLFVSVSHKQQRIGGQAVAHESGMDVERVHMGTEQANGCLAAA